MKKVNIDKELNQLYKKAINDYKVYYTDGVIIKKDDMSKYITKCFDQSAILKFSINGRLTYRYFVDKKNSVCVLFTDTYIEDENDEKEIAIKANTIVVEIYISEEEFQQSQLGYYYHFHFVLPSTDNYSWENEYTIRIAKNIMIYHS